MDCCHCESIEIQFDLEKARKKLSAYRENGPQKTTRLLVQGLQAAGVAGATLLDIGGGIGAVQFELLRVGAASVVNLEASQAYLSVCQEEAQRQGVSDQITHLHGDFAHQVRR